MIPTLAFLLSALAALASYRWSRLCAAAFGLAFAASGVYLCIAHFVPLHHAAGELEPLRLVSVVTGAMGVVELVLWSRATRCRPDALRASAQVVLERLSWPTRATVLAELHREEIIASLLVASSLVDGASWLWWRETGQWGPLPAVSCLLYAGVCVVGFWRRWRA